MVLARREDVLAHRDEVDGLGHVLVDDRDLQIGDGHAQEAAHGEHDRDIKSNDARGSKTPDDRRYLGADDDKLEGDVACVAILHRHGVVAVRGDNRVGGRLKNGPVFEQGRHGLFAPIGHDDRFVRDGSVEGQLDGQAVDAGAVVQNHHVGETDVSAEGDAESRRNDVGELETIGAVVGVEDVVKILTCRSLEWKIKLSIDKFTS